MIFELSFRDERQNVGGPVLGGRLSRLRAGAVTESGAAAVTCLLTCPRIVFLVHGYNVSLSRGRAQLRRFAAMLPHHQDAALVTTLWPGDHWSGVLSYSFEGRDADDTARSFARFIEDHVPAGKPLTFVSHSLGARVVLGTLKRLPEEHRIACACVMAAAVDDDSPSDPQVYRPAVLDADDVKVLWSPDDLVLRFAYPAGDLLQSFLFWRDEPGLALGLHGPRPSGRHAVPANVDSDRHPVGGVGHLDYLPPEEPDPPNQAQRRTAEYVDRVLPR